MDHGMNTDWIEVQHLPTPSKMDDAFELLYNCGISPETYKEKWKTKWEKVHKIKQSDDHPFWQQAKDYRLDYRLMTLETEMKVLKAGVRDLQKITA